MEKTKEKGNIKKVTHLIANGVSFLNGEECKRYAKVPVILLDYETPTSAHEFAKGERFKFWFKLEDAEWTNLNKQLNPSLKELSIWFDEENVKKLKEFLNSNNWKEV